jgi:hypothetical protein
MYREGVSQVVYARRGPVAVLLTNPRSGAHVHEVVTQRFVSQWFALPGHKDELCLSRVWPNLRTPLLGSQRREDVEAAFENFGQPYAQEFVPRLVSDIFELTKETGFPQRAKAQVKYIAESLAGRPIVSMRTSRDICGKMRAALRAKSPYKILRKEFYVVCGCGYKGPAELDACRKCGAQIDYLPDVLFGSKTL